jgi:hypothetical protein
MVMVPRIPAAPIGMQWRRTEDLVDDEAVVVLVVDASAVWAGVDVDERGVAHLEIHLASGDWKNLAASCNEVARWAENYAKLLIEADS